MDWDNAFDRQGGKTRVRVMLTFASAEEMQKIVEMGFKEGFAMHLDQLERLLAERSGNVCPQEVALLDVKQLMTV